MVNVVFKDGVSHTPSGGKDLFNRVFPYTCSLYKNREKSIWKVVFNVYRNHVFMYIEIMLTCTSRRPIGVYKGGM